ncbi:MAG TPA: diguanylate cyclase [Clostridiales bacterium]|nr:diguanylate cyclase [Clostridiales bacterium]
MNKSFNKYKEEQIHSMFFILRILTLFFCATPVFQSVFEGLSTDEAVSYNVFAAAVALIILSLVMVFWFAIDAKKKENKVIRVLEILIFFGLCMISIHVSGLHESNYKFLFIFLIVAYTIEYNIQMGLIIAGCSSAYILLLDLMHSSTQSVNIYFENDLALAAMFIVVAWTLGFYVRLERNHIDTLINFVNRDGLTDLYTHRYFHDYLKEYFDKVADIEKEPVSLIMMDLDGFKAYNDIFGHQQGDQVLKIVAKLIKENIKEGQIACRYGGEEFGVILPGVSKEEAVATASKLKNIIDSYVFEGQDHLPRQNLTISAGVSQPLGKGDTPAALIDRTDSALYRAKFLCSNRVEMYASVFEEFSHKHGEDEQLINALQPIKTLITVINSRDRYTYSHVERVVLYCEKVANYMKMDYETKKKLICAAYLHDLGKINIPKEILISDEKLTNEQWVELKKHPKDSAEIITHVPELKDLAPIVLAHHERYDGTGYPNGLKGDEIPYLTRLLTIADAFDAMTHRRPYKATKTKEQAFQELRDFSGTQFDPDLTEIFIAAMQSNDSVCLVEECG